MTYSKKTTTMETEISVRIDPYEVFDNLTLSQQETFIANALDDMSPKCFANVIGMQDREAVITCFTAEEICDNADEQELVDELTRRGWKLVEEDE